ncbi:F-box/kelch-repeat protein [Citrus sinensis]|nr:F-box/kelch-repeat protein [Citrus sinensis]
MICECPTGEEDSLRQDFESLSVSKRLVRSVSRKLRNKNLRNYDGDDEDDVKGVSLKCLTLYGRGGGCKVGAETGEECGDSSSRRRSSASEEGKGYKPFCGSEEIGVGVDCFSYGVKEKFWKKSNSKNLELQDSVRNSRMHIFLPDDTLEMCLVRFPLTSLMNARLVCKKWRYLTTTPRFLQMRREGLHQNPWLFLFGAVKDGYYSGEIHALDVSQDQWHRIDASILKGRFMFSVVSIMDDVYVVGGCSSLTSFGRVDGSSFKTHKRVLVFSPLTKSWWKVASMRYARSMPILGISEVSPEFSIIPCHQSHQDRRFPRSRLGGVSDVYEDPHRLSLRRQYRNSFDGFEGSLLPNRKSYKFIRQKSDQSIAKASKRFVLIAVGGLGSWDEPLDSGEIYDSVSNKWMEIQRLPVDFGVVSSGVVCNGIFYVYSETEKLAGYDIERGFWIGIQTSPFPPRWSLFILSVSWCEWDGQIGCRNKAVRKLWELDLMYLSWTEVSVHPDAPMDWSAAFVLDFLTVCDVSEKRMNWSHISRNHMAYELDATSCMTKSLAVLHL